MAEHHSDFEPFMPTDPAVEAYHVVRDGDAWGAYGPGFADLAVSDVAWAATPEEALAKLRRVVRVKAGPKPDLASGG